MNNNNNTINCKSCDQALFGNVDRYNHRLKTCENANKRFSKGTMLSVKNTKVVDRLKKQLCKVCHEIDLRNEVTPTKKEVESLCYIAEFIRAEVYKSDGHEEEDWNDYRNSLGSDEVLYRDLISIIDKLKAVKS